MLTLMSNEVILYVAQLSPKPTVVDLSATCQRLRRVLFHDVFYTVVVRGTIDQDINTLYRPRHQHTPSPSNTNITPCCCFYRP